MLLFFPLDHIIGLFGIIVIEEFDNFVKMFNTYSNSTLFVFRESGLNKCRLIKQ